MPDGIFRSGTLELPEFPVTAEPFVPSWIDNDINCLLTVLSALLMILILKNFLWVFPQIRQSFFRSRVCLNLEHSVSMANARDLSALVLVLPFCLICDRFSVFTHFLKFEFPLWAGPVVAFAILLIYVLVHRFLCVCFKPRRMDYDYSNALYKTVNSFFIIFCLVLLPSVGVFELLDISDSVARLVIFIEAGLIYLVYLVRIIQFLAAYCNGFLTILYLCALEFVPVAAVVAACAFLNL